MPQNNLKRKRVSLVSLIYEVHAVESRWQTMRRLFVATVVLLAGPALAVDYVQCQAMQKVIWQLEEEYRRAKVEAGNSMIKQAVGELCGSIPPVKYKANWAVPTQTDESKAERIVFMECRDSAITANSGRIKAAERNSPSVIQIYNRLQRVRYDFGRYCY